MSSLVDGGGVRFRVVRKSQIYRVSPGLGGGSSGAPTSAEYIVISANVVLTNERVLTAGSNISFADAGAGSTLTISSTGASDGDAQILAWLGL